MKRAARWRFLAVVNSPHPRVRPGDWCASGVPTPGMGAGLVGLALPSVAGQEGDLDRDAAKERPGRAGRALLGRFGLDVRVGQAIEHLLKQRIPADAFGSPPETKGRVLRQGPVRCMAGPGLPRALLAASDPRTRGCRPIKLPSCDDAFPDSQSEYAAVGLYHPAIDEARKDSDCLAAFHACNPLLTGKKGATPSSVGLVPALVAP